MKTIGLIGGMSWESSAVYYELINQRVKAQLGGFHSCKCMLLSVDFAEFETFLRQENWSAINDRLCDAAQKLEAAGADLLILCTNTMHICSEGIRQAVSIPFLHIAEATAEAIKAQGLDKVGLLGTRFTMEKDFYKETLRAQGIDVIVPRKAARDQVDEIVFRELVMGEIKEDSRRAYQRIIKELEEEGAQGVVLGCTEIPLLISGEDVDIPVFDTTTIHAELAVDWALGVLVR
ncbi:MAG: aspartate/glutamate racemase family protein [Saprospiraceae bacterium]